MVGKIKLWRITFSKESTIVPLLICVYLFSKWVLFGIVHFLKRKTFESCFYVSGWLLTCLLFHHHRLSLSSCASWLLFMQIFVHIRLEF